MPVGRHASTLSTSAACPLARGVSASDFPPIRRNYLPPPHGNRMRVASARRTRQGVRHTGSERTPPRTPPEVHAEIKRRPRSVVASAPPPVRRLDFADFPFLAAILVRGTLSTERNKGAPPPGTCPSPSRLESLAPLCPLRVAPRNATRSRPDRPRTKPDRRVSGAMDRGTVGRGSVHGLASPSGFTRTRGRVYAPANTSIAAAAVSRLGVVAASGRVQLCRPSIRPSVRPRLSASGFSVAHSAGSVHPQSLRSPTSQPPRYLAGAAGASAARCRVRSAILPASAQSFLLDQTPQVPPGAGGRTPRWRAWPWRSGTPYRHGPCTL